MYILGLSFFYHEAAAALIKDGELVAASAEERFSRKKHDSSYPELAIKFCLEQAGISEKDLDYVVFYEKPFLKFERLFLTSLATYPDSYRLFRESMLSFLPEKLWVTSIIRDKLDINRGKILTVPHHISHAASSYYCSPFEEAAVLTLDGVGEWSCGSYGIGTLNKLRISKEIRFPHSIGLLYSAFTAFLGFEVNDGEYKVMGMAPYGTPKYADKVYQLMKVNSDGSIKLNMKYFRFHNSPDQNVTSNFTELFGEPRDKDLHFFTPASGYPSYFGDKPSNYEEIAKLNQHYADIAASLQLVTEEIILKMVDHVHTKTKQENLVIAGGVGLNSVANGRVVRESKFRHVYIQPAAGDDGAALGAALYVYHHILGNKRKFVMTHAYYGKDFSEKEIKSFLDSKKIKYRFVEDKDKLASFVADALSKKEVVGLYQGRFEWGPRALGNRSIIADPRSEEMKEIVNTKIKFREPYRPFAPAVLEEKANEYFELKDANSNYLAKFMLMVCPVKEDKKKLIPAVTHVDGSARLQTVDKDTNPLYRKIIEKFEEKTGVAVIMNTSFNLKGEPIVTTPENAYNTFMKSGLDYLVMERFVISK
ncbi:MAG: hypothetical protein A2802_01285 [Candidatus Woykebacteria bacterium RIFCSPHIGHO2_01_FULL_43_29]|uniref:Carbamoyltransferase n=2 Tax=Candidatus Woykeibacteriota TaxID=1817899 RepID=A0A1G1WYU9_9BACT|nr:MAG: hypothetical protein A2802_01285 [Candidatus Woykebacteria bacterium RIFCSPHIGHO2_01_FULL_43_29]OGY29099.1 MAG: hypothetical protein A3J50_02330 [Candidatus Woykebacteria bacterium RIFCSPHIGHO2_02_FULL_43_16b]OGY32893.1 MAG: hypothetical protein A3A61_02645 [Candidatus Woykebacteria bacterium RIFCSPLOWO2_01_FULL_43_14]